MNRILLRTIGFILVGLALSSLALRLVAAAVSGEPFHGRNVYGLLVGTYLGLAIFAVAGVVGVVWLLQRLRRSLRRRPENIPNPPA